MTINRDEKPRDQGQQIRPGRTTSLPSNLPSITRSYITLDGDPANGKVHHLAWHHDSRNGMDREELISFGQRNAAILRQLPLLAVSSVFLEGVDASEHGTQLAHDYDLERLAGYFPTRAIPRRLSDYQALALAGSSIGSSIAYFYPHVSLHGGDATHSKVRDLPLRFPDPELRDAVVFNFRETVALQAVLETFRTAPPERRVAAIVYGSRHVFNKDDLPLGLSEHEMPRITKHEFQDWSLFDDTRRFQLASCPIEKILAIRSATRLLGYIWSPLLTSTEQLLILPKLKAEPDFIGSAEQLRATLLRYASDGPRKPEVISLIESMYKEKKGPFSDVVLRPRSGAALARVPGEFESVEIAREKHAFTQLEMVRRASRVEWWAYATIITKKGQMMALDKLELNPTHTEDQLFSFLLQTSGDDKVREEVIRRQNEEIAPFSPNRES